MKLFYDLLIWLVGKQMAPGRIKLYMSFIYFKHFNYRYMMLIEDENKSSKIQTWDRLDR